MEAKAPAMKVRRVSRAGFRDGDGGGKARILNDNGHEFREGLWRGPLIAKAR